MTCQKKYLDQLNNFISFALLAGGVLLVAACGPRQANGDTFETSEGAIEEATITDQAETTVITTDSAVVKLPVDSINKSRQKL